MCCCKTEHRTTSRSIFKRCFIFKFRKYPDPVPPDNKHPWMMTGTLLDEKAGRIIWFWESDDSYCCDCDD